MFEKPSKPTRRNVGGNDPPTTFIVNRTITGVKNPAISDPLNATAGELKRGMDLDVATRHLKSKTGYPHGVTEPVLLRARIGHYNCLSIGHGL